MYKLNYCKTKLTMIDISKVTHSDFGAIDITSEEMKTILQNVNKGLTCFVDTKNQTFYFGDDYCCSEKLKEIKAYRDELLKEHDDYKIEWYISFLSEYHGIVDDLVVLEEYYRKIMLIEKAYAEATNWLDFKVKIVEEYSVEPDPNVYELIKPDFITSPKDNWIK